MLSSFLFVCKINNSNLTSFGDEYFDEKVKLVRNFRFSNFKCFHALHVENLKKLILSFKQTKISLDKSKLKARLFNQKLGKMNNKI